MDHTSPACFRLWTWEIKDCLCFLCNWVHQPSPTWNSTQQNSKPQCRSLHHHAARLRNTLSGTGPCWFDILWIFRSVFPHVWTGELGLQAGSRQQEQHQDLVTWLEGSEYRKYWHNPAHYAQLKGMTHCVAKSHSSSPTWGCEICPLHLPHPLGDEQQPCCGQRSLVIQVQPLDADCPGLLGHWAGRFTWTETKALLRSFSTANNRKVSRQKFLVEPHKSTLGFWVVRTRLSMFYFELWRLCSYFDVKFVPWFVWWSSGWKEPHRFGLWSSGCRNSTSSGNLPAGHIRVRMYWCPHLVFGSRTTQSPNTYWKGSPCTGIRCSGAGCFYRMFPVFNPAAPWSTENLSRKCGPTHLRIHPLTSISSGSLHASTMFTLFPSVHRIWFQDSLWIRFCSCLNLLCFTVMKASVDGRLERWHITLLQSVFHWSDVVTETTFCCVVDFARGYLLFLIKHQLVDLASPDVLTVSQVYSLF